MTPPSSDPRIGEIIAEIKSLEDEQKECEFKARELMEAEARGEGAFAQEIFTLRQRKHMLGAKEHHARVRLNHLRLGAPPPGEEGPR